MNALRGRWSMIFGAVLLLAACSGGEGSETADAGDAGGADVDSGGPDAEGPTLDSVEAAVVQPDDGELEVATSVASMEEPTGSAPADIRTRPVDSMVEQVGPGGGTLQLDALEFTVPAGALSEEVEVRLYEYDIEMPEELEVRSPLYRCEAPGVTFDPPLRVTFTLADQPPDDVAVLWTNDGGESFDILEAVVDGNTVTVESSHCSLLLAGIEGGLNAYMLYEDIEALSCDDGSFEAADGICCPNGMQLLGETCYSCPAGTLVGPAPFDTVESGVGCYTSPLSAASDCGVFCGWGTGNERGPLCCPAGGTCPADGSRICTGVGTDVQCEDPGRRSINRCDDWYCCQPQHDIVSCNPTGCVDFDPCEPGGVRSCNASRTCYRTGSDTATDLEGEFHCGPCAAGLTEDGPTGCVDIDECETNPCRFSTQECVNSFRSYECTCPVEACECEPNAAVGAADSGCFTTDVCTSTARGWECLDRNECTDGVIDSFGATPRPACGEHVVCENTVPGAGRGWECSGCETGYDDYGSGGPGVVVCEDVNECLFGDCGANRQCTNTDGGHTCGNCESGYEDIGGTCTAVATNPCDTDNGGCDALVTCTYDGTNRICGDCPMGYAGFGSDECVDIDECVISNGGCDALVTCTNTVGSRSCGDCPSGYSGDGETGCLNDDPCGTNNGGCDALTTCTNGASPGERTCGTCPMYHSGDGETGCTYVNPCLTDNGGCDLLTSCSDTGMGRTCGVCPGGYTGDGETGCQPCHPSMGTEVAGWGDVEAVPHLSSGYISDVATLANGQVVVAGLSNDYGTPYFTQRHGPATWADVWEPPLAAPESQRVRLAVSGDTVHAIWSETGDDPTANAAVRMCGGWTMDGDYVAGTTLDSSVLGLQVEATPTGTAVSLTNTFTDRWEVIASERTAGGTWAAPISLDPTDALGTSFYVRSGSDVAGNIHAAWQTPGIDIAWAVRDADTGSWSSPTIVGPGMAYPGFDDWFDFTVGENGDALLAWCIQQVGDDIMRVRAYNGTTDTWGDSVDIADDVSCDREVPSSHNLIDVHITRRGHRYVAYETETGVFVSGRTLSAPLWSPPVQLVSGDVDGLQLESACVGDCTFTDEPVFVVWSNTSELAVSQLNLGTNVWSAPTTLHPINWCPTYPACDPEICDNGADDDGDGRTDCSDWECASDPSCDRTVEWNLHTASTANGLYVVYNHNSDAYARRWTAP